MVRVQTKLTVGAADDHYEREADDVARRVVQALGGIEQTEARDRAELPSTDRAPVAQRVSRLQRRAEVGAEGGDVDSRTAAQIDGARGGGAPLEAGVRGNMESAFGSDFSSVRVHTGSQSADLNDRLQAKAFTVGSDIFFRGSMPDPSARGGQELLAHELTHVVQQGGAPAGAQRVQRLKNPFKGLFGKKKPKVDAPTDVQTTTGSDLVEMVRNADMKTRIFMSTNKGFLAKVESDLDPVQKEEVLSLLGAATQVEIEKKAKAEQELKEKNELEAKEKEEAKAKQEQEAKAKLEEEEKTKKEGEEQQAREAEALRVAEVDKKLKTSTEIRALGLAAFIKYADETPSWDQRSTITVPEKVDFTAILAFAREPGVAAAMGKITVAAVNDEPSGALGGLLADALADLRAYVAAVTTNEPISVSAQASVVHARIVGNSLARMIAGFPVWMLRSALDEAVLLELINKKYVDDVISYYATSKPTPVFQADKGKDFMAYVRFRKEGGDPASYHSGVLQGFIRNFHRFQMGALDGLVKNIAGGNTAKRPFTLVLHTAVDHNGAFHRDPKMTEVVTNSKIFAIIVEGGETLADYQSQIAPLAAQFGVDGKIDQVMFAGHGGSRSIEMAGGAKQGKNGKIEQTGESISLDKDIGAANALFDEVLANMNKDTASLLDPTAKSFRRILFNSCLTNSNTVRKKLTSDPVLAKAEIQDYLGKNASLATYLGTRAKSKGYDVTSLGANASIGQVDLIDKEGGLDLVSKADPRVTAPKLEYAEFGKEPGGVLRAALEAWSLDETATLEAMQRRASAGSTKWDDVIIQSIYTTMLASKTVSARGEFLRLFGWVASGLSHMKSDAHCKVSELSGLLKQIDAAYFTPIFTDLMASDEWANSKSLQLVMYQLWGGCKPSEVVYQQRILHLLTNNFTAKTAMLSKDQYVDIAYLESKGLLTPLLTGAADKGRTVLALIAMLDGGAPASAKSYLKANLVAAAPEVPGLPAVAAVPLVPPSPPPRAEIAAVPEVKGRPKVDEIAGKRPAAAEVPDLAELPMLPEAKAPPKKEEPAKGESGAESVPTEVIADAPGRAGRAKRDEVEKIAAVKAFFKPEVDFETLVGKRATEEEIVAKL